MTKEIEIVCPPGQHEDEAVLKRLAASALNIQPEKYFGIKNFKAIY
jgi:hypothetical protein